MSNFEANFAATFTLTASFDQHIDYSRFHLKSATVAMAEAESIERRYEQTQQTDELEIHMAHVSSCIMCCVAAIESKINEYVFLHRDNINKTQINIDPIAQKIFPKFKINKLSQHILDNTNVATKLDILWHISSNSFLPASSFKENLIYLAEIRNSLTHYTPEWKSESIQLKNLQKKIKNKFTTNPFYPNPSELTFPFSFMSASCAKWAVTTSQEALSKVCSLNI